MGKTEKFLYPILQAFSIIGGGILTAYSWVSTFFDLPPIIQDWRWGLGLGIILLVGGMGWKNIDLYRRYVWWSEPEILISPEPIDKYIDGNFYKSAQLKIFNKEELEITKCFATLKFTDDITISQEKVTIIPLIPSLTKEADRIKWQEELDMNDNCEITIPPRESRYINLADMLGTLRYHLRKGDIEANWMIGSPLHTVKIRIDGRFNERAMKPSCFEGYIYAANFMKASETYIKSGRIKKQHEIIADQISELKMIFREGNWRKDREVLWYLKKQEIFNKKI